MIFFEFLIICIRIGREISISSSSSKFYFQQNTTMEQYQENTM